MAHVCKAVIFACMDFRLEREFERWLEDADLKGQADIVRVAGASKSILDGSPAVSEYLLRQIELSVKLHEACEVILVHHSSCGAYASEHNFHTPEQEFWYQQNDIRKIKDIILDRFPGVRIKAFWAKMIDQEGKVVEFLPMDSL